MAVNIWTEELVFPSHSNVLYASAAINGNNFIAFDNDDKQSLGLSMYVNRKWTKIATMQFKKTFSNDGVAAFDHKLQIMYVLDPNRQQMSQISLIPNKCQCFDFSQSYNNYDLSEINLSQMYRNRIFSAFSTMIVIKNELHLFGGSQSNTHSKWCPQSETFKKITELPHAIYGFQIIHDRHRNRILLFGGYRSSVGHSKNIYQYNISQNLWIELSVQMPNALCIFGCTTVRNDQFVAIFGGNGGQDYHDRIDIFSLSDDTFIECKIKCPKKGRFAAMSVNQSNQGLAVYGYIRKECHTLNIAKNTFPTELMELIQKYCHTENIHLFAIDEQESYHWKASAYDLF